MKKSVKYIIKILLVGIFVAVMLVGFKRYFQFESKDAKERKNEIQSVLKVAGLKKDEEDGYYIRELKEKLGITEDEDAVILHTRKVNDIEIYDSLLNLYINNYRYYFPDLIEQYPELVSMNEDVIFDQIKNNKGVFGKDKNTPLFQLYMSIKYKGDTYLFMYLDECLEAYDSYLSETGERFHDKTKAQLTLEDYDALVRYIGEHLDREKYPIIFRFFYGGREIIEKERYTALAECFDLPEEAYSELSVILSDIDKKDYSQYERYGKHLVNNKVWREVRKLIVKYGNVAVINKEMSLDEFIMVFDNINEGELNLAENNFSEGKDCSDWLEVIKDQLGDEKTILSFSVSGKNETYVFILSKEQFDNVIEISEKLTGEGFAWDSYHGI